MEQEFISNLLVNGGSNDIFAIFLFWQNRELKKKAEAQEEKYDKKEVDLRARYDSVIDEYLAKEDKLYSRIEQLIRLLDEKD